MHIYTKVENRGVSPNAKTTSNGPLGTLCMYKHCICKAHIL